MMIRKEPKASNGWNNGDLDTAFQLFACGMVWDGNLTSKGSRDHFVQNGYAVRSNGMQSLTGKGVFAFLMTPAVWESARKRYQNYKRNPFVADAERIKRAMT